MNTLLIIIDLQKDFINSNTKHIINKITELEKKYKFIVFTKFINNKDSIYVKKLNYHGCITEDSQKIVINTNNNKIINKTIYSAYNNELINYIKDNNIDELHLCGIDTDACALKTALDLFENGYDVKVIEDCSMSHSGIEYHNSAIKMLKKLIGNQNIIKMLGSDNDD